MEVLEDIILADLPEKLRNLKTPVTAHVRVVIQEIKPLSKTARPRFAETPGHGLWQNREDLSDPIAFVDKLRLTRHPNVF